MTDFAVWQSTRYPDLSMIVRPETSDVKACDEVIDRNVYQRPRLGFTIAPDDRWVDAGAYIGAFSVVARHLGAWSVAVEPVDEHVRLASRNMGREHPDDPVVLTGVVTPPGVDGDQAFHLRPGPVAWRSSILPQKDTVATSRASAYPIDDLVAGFDCNAVKLDIEGTEIELMETWTPPAQVNKLAFEWGFDVDPSTTRLRAVLDRLRALGYTLNYHSRIDRFDTWQWSPWGTLILAWK